MADMKELAKVMEAMKVTFSEVVNSLEEIVPADYTGKVVDVSKGFSFYAILGEIEGRINDLIIDFAPDAKTNYGVATLKSRDGLDFIAETLLHREGLVQRASLNIEEAMVSEGAAPAAERNSLANYLMMVG